MFHPALFSTSMVQAIDDGRKTITRRLNNLDEVNTDPDNWEYIRFWNGYAKFTEKHNATNEKYVKCNYGDVGHVLWVRESWNYATEVPSKLYWYKADDTTPGDFLKWKPSIHMPKSACRFFLEVTSIHAERLQSITETDAKAEGVENVIADLEKFGARARGMILYRDYSRNDNSLINYPANGFDNAKTSFETLWHKINGAESWNANPWVWVIKFKKISKPENFR